MPGDPVNLLGVLCLHFLRMRFADLLVLALPGEKGGIGIQGRGFKIYCQEGSRGGWEKIEERQFGE